MNETLSLHAAEFGVGITAVAGSMLVLPRSAIGDGSVPGGGLAGTSPTANGRAAPLVSALPGAAMHGLPVCEFPRGDAAVTVPVVLPLTAPAINTGIAGGKSNGGREVVGVAFEMGVADRLAGLIVVVVLAEALGVVAVTLMTDGESATAAGVQLTLVPGIVGSSANGGEVSVVAGAPGTVAAEKRLVNGLGPPSGDETIAPGVVGSASSVVPMVDTCAAQLPLPSKNIAIEPKIHIADRLRQPPSLVMSLQAPVAVPPWPHRRDPPSD